MRLRPEDADPTLANLPKHRMEGHLVAAHDTTMTVGTATGPQRLVRAQVHRVDAAPPKRRGDSVANGTLIGARVGVGVVAGMARENTTSDPLPAPVVFLVVGGGAAIGALMDAATKGFDYRTIYLSEPRRR